MREIFVTLFALVSISAYASEVKLNHRILNNCDGDTCYYDFFNMTQQYGYGLSLGFGNDWGENEFDAVQVVDEVGLIVDLGKKSCEDMENEYQDTGSGYPTSADRKDDPMFWLMYSKAWDKIQEGAGLATVKAKEGHCYLMYKSSSDQQVVVAFHVKELTRDVSVLLDEVEIFKKAEIRDVR